MNVLVACVTPVGEMVEESARTLAFAAVAAGTVEVVNVVTGGRAGMGTARRHGTASAGSRRATGGKLVDLEGSGNREENLALSRLRQFVRGSEVTLDHRGGKIARR